MLTKIQTKAEDLLKDINNFLKTEAEIISDFKTRVSNSIRDIDRFQSEAQITYNRIINKISESECIRLLSDNSLYMEENY